MNNKMYREKLKSLMLMMIRWAELNKQRFIGDKYGTWKKEFKYVTGLDLKLDMKYSKKLTKEEMTKCNKYYKEYQCIRVGKQNSHTIEDRSMDSTYQK